MTSCHQKVTEQGKIWGFSTIIIENSAFALSTCYEKFFSRKSYHKATALISTVLFILGPMSWHIVMDLIQKWNYHNQQAKSFQMRYHLSKLNNQNYGTLNIQIICNMSQVGRKWQIAIPMPASPKITKIDSFTKMYAIFVFVFLSVVLPWQIWDNSHYQDSRWGCERRKDIWMILNIQLLGRAAQFFNVCQCCCGGPFFVEDN